MRNPSGDWARMHRGRRNRKYVFIFASILVTALLISILGADLQVFRFGHASETRLHRWIWLKRATMAWGNAPLRRGMFT